MFCLLMFFFLIDVLCDCVFQKQTVMFCLLMFFFVGGVILVQLN